MVDGNIARRFTQPATSQKWCYFVTPGGPQAKRDFFCISNFVEVNTDFNPSTTQTDSYLQLNIPFDFILELNWWSEIQILRLIDTLIRYKVPQVRIGVIL